VEESKKESSDNESLKQETAKDGTDEDKNSFNFEVEESSYDSIKSSAQQSKIEPI